MQKLMQPLVDAVDRMAHRGNFILTQLGGQSLGPWVECPFPGEIVYGQIGEISVCRLSAPAHQIERRTATIRPADQNFVKLVLQLSGSAELRQSGRSVTLAAGEWSFYDAARSYAFSNHGDVEQLVLLVPKEALCGRSVAPSDFAIEIFGKNDGLERVAASLLISVAKEMTAFSLGSTSDVGDTALRLLRRTVEERLNDRRLYSMRDILTDRIKAHIERHLQDPDLSIDTIATAMNCTKRNLHKAFSEDSVTIGQFISNLRLARCMDDLRNPRMAKRSVTDIAFSWGFNNAAHFSRAFREKYGTTPRSCR